MGEHKSTVQLEVSHVLSKDQLNAISEQVYQVTIESIKKARQDLEIDNDIIYSKAALCRYLDNMSPNYLEELLAKGLPQGRTLSDRKICFSKSEVKKWLLDNN